ncbi:MAG TPA: hypothetical protein VK483_14030 [Chitinophagaceae bacterium]|nr:hypothetical protein [Chitinophagaceae bacterium]
MTKINHIVFKGNNNKESTVNLSPADQQLFMTLAACLVNASKELIK